MKEVLYFIVFNWVVMGIYVVNIDFMENRPGGFVPNAIYMIGWNILSSFIGAILVTILSFITILQYFSWRDLGNG